MKIVKEFILREIAGMCTGADGGNFAGVQWNDHDQ